MVRQDFRVDLFKETVCSRFSLSEGMKTRARLMLDLDHIKVYFCAHEDIFLFKTMTEREGDLQDCESLASIGLDWPQLLPEIRHQIQHTEQDVWITWIGERLDLLEERGIHIPIMQEIDKLRKEYFQNLEERLRGSQQKA